MKKKQYDLNFKKMVVAKGKEIGNMTAVARKYELDPKMVLRWTRALNRKDLDQLDGTSIKQALERDILKDLLKKNEPALADKIEIA